MASFINTNMVSLNTQNNLSKSQDALAQSIKRLSTGLRINSAKDDAAGLAISNRMDATIRGQTVAIRNTNDAVSFSQTADGALAQINNNLQRLRELAVQASNGTNSAGDRELLNTEFNQLQQEVTRIQNNTAFNGTNALQSNNVSVQIGAGNTQYDKISISGIDLSEVTKATATDDTKPSTTTFTREQFDAIVADKANAGKNLNFNAANGHIYQITTTNSSWSAAKTFAEAQTLGGQKGYLVNVSNSDENTFVSNKINSAGGYNWAWTGASDSSTYASLGAAPKVFVNTGGPADEIGKVSYTNFESGQPDGNGLPGAEGFAHLWHGQGQWNDWVDGGNCVSVIEFGGNTTSTITTGGPSTAQLTIGTGATTLGQYQVSDKSTFTIVGSSTTATTQSTWTDSSGAALAIGRVLQAGELFYSKTSTTPAAADGSTAAVTATFASAPTGTAILSAASIQAASSNSQIFGNASGTNILTQADALNAINSIDISMKQVNVAQIQQGATQNRLQAVISTLTSSNESTINARSHIMDTDFAAETASMARANILQQAGMAMLAQANTSNNGIMALMR